MFFHFIPDGVGGYYVYNSGGGCPESDDLVGGLLTVIMTIIPIACLIMMGERILLPVALLLLALILSTTPQSETLHQNELLAKTKQAIAIPLAYYGVTCISYAIGLVKGDDRVMLTLLTYIIGFIPVLLTMVPTEGATFPMTILWAGAFIAGVGEGFPTITNFILHASYLESVVIFIYGVVMVIKYRDTNGIYLLPKLIAFGLGCIPLVVLAVLPNMGNWLMIALIIALYFGICFLYGFVLKKPSLFSDFLIYPFLLSLFCSSIARGYALYPEWLFPSDVIQMPCNLLLSMQSLFEPAVTLCSAFCGAISDLLYQITDLLFRILPNIELDGIHVDVPWLVGGMIGLLIIVQICNFIGTRYAKLKK